jgi:hypothetical protein
MHGLIRNVRANVCVEESVVSLQEQDVEPVDVMTVLPREAQSGAGR